jgi:hypothetical protein
MDCLNRWLTSGTALFSIGSLAACIDGTQDPAVADERAEVVDWDAPITGAEGGWIVGDVGPASGVDAAAQLSTWDGGTVTTVENVVVLPERAVMLYASITRASSLLRPGVRDSFAVDDRTLDGPSIVLLGCTGREVNVYDEYDATADFVDVVVEDAIDGPPGAVDVSLTGHWGTRSATSSFRLLR